MDYTKGEWIQQGTIIFVPGKEGAVLCKMAEPRVNTYVEFRPLELGSKDWNEQMANAQLITAVPLLYEALKNLVARVEQGLALGDKLDITPARKALAKAEGKCEQPTG